MNEQLRDLYRENWDVFAEAMEKGSSAPLLLSASEAYQQADYRFLFVGQQTQGWDRPEKNEAPIEALMDTYEEFRFGENRSYTPFWRAVHEIRREVNPDSPDKSILWSNLGKVDLENDLPPEEILGPLLRADILPREVEITSPDAVVFFTGPTSRYDNVLRRTFDGVELSEVETNLHKVSHPVLPEVSFRTYHPNYLQRAKQWDLVEAVSQRIGGELTPSTSIYS